MSVDVALSKSGNLSSTYCFTSWDQLLSDFIANSSASLAGNATVWNFGSDTPDASSRDRPWLRLNSDGSPDRVYVYWNGLWVSKHPVPPGSGEDVRIWTGTTGALDTYDGGAAGAVTEVSGPMWQVATAFAARFPVGVGTFAGGTEIAVGDEGGEDNHVLTVPELPAHQHNTDPPSSQLVVFPPTSGFTGAKADSEGNAFGHINVSEFSTGENEPHNNLPPYKTVYFIKRTARIYYTI